MHAENAYRQNYTIRGQKWFCGGQRSGFAITDSGIVYYLSSLSSYPQEVPQLQGASSCVFSDKFYFLKKNGLF